MFITRKELARQIEEAVQHERERMLEERNRENAFHFMDERIDRINARLNEVEQRQREMMRERVVEYDVKCCTPPANQ